MTSSGVGVQVAGEAVALGVFAAVALRRGSCRLVRTGKTATYVCGALRALGTGLFIAAVTVRASAGTAVAANLYPLFTVLTAVIVLREHISRAQTLAIVIATAGIAALALA